MQLFELRELGGETKRGKEVVSWTHGECWGFFTVVYYADLIKCLQLLPENTFFPCLFVLSFIWSICWIADVVEKEECYITFGKKPILYHFSLSAVFNVKLIDISQSTSRFKKGFSGLWRDMENYLHLLVHTHTQSFQITTCWSKVDKYK